MKLKVPRSKREGDLLCDFIICLPTFIRRSRGDNFFSFFSNFIPTKRLSCGTTAPVTDVNYLMDRKSLFEDIQFFMCCPFTFT